MGEREAGDGRGEEGVDGLDMGTSCGGRARAAMRVTYLDSLRCDHSFPTRFTPLPPSLPLHTPLSSPLSPDPHLGTKRVVGGVDLEADRARVLSDALALAVVPPVAVLVVVVHDVQLVVPQNALRRAL